ncbi:MAG TPA: hypothetical protein VD997_05215 [Phycisphaerales bacterium]|nr:hypothetical protein [Phycisphaerales bacterium]
MLAAQGILCESCGYPLADLPIEGSCPECGRAIAHSLPEHRPGSPWQVARDWWGTYIAFLRSPRLLFQGIRIESRAADALARRNASTASVIILVGGLLATALVSMAAGRMTQGGVQFRSGATITILRPLGLVHSILFAFAPWLVMLIDARLSPALYRALYKWPVSSTCYRAVRGHASFAWLGFGLAFAVLSNVEPALLRYASRINNLNLAVLLQSMGTAVFLLATMYVAWLHHIGVKVCRYASEPGKAPSSTTPAAQPQGA